MATASTHPNGAFLHALTVGIVRLAENVIIVVVAS